MTDVVSSAGPQGGQPVDPNPRQARPEPTDQDLAGFELVALLGDIGANGLLGLRTVGGTRVCLVKIGAVVRAIANNCTHRDFPMSEGEIVEEEQVECAWHGARFDTATGEAVQGPAHKDIVRYAVRQRGDEIWVGGVMH